MYFLYILLCSDGSLYTGITNDISIRLQNHKSGYGSKYVKDRLPFKLIYSYTFTDKYTAAKRERQIKGWRRAKKVRILKLDM
jgi:putative endonuclease